MKNKILCLIMALFIFAPCVMMLSACTPNEEPPLTNVELAAIYKDIADSTWEKMDIQNPTTSLMSAIPDFKTETSDADQVENIKLNANGMAGLLYMLGLLYENENFITTNNIAVFDANISIMQTNTIQNYILSSSIDKSLNKLYLEAVITTMGNKQYSNLEADYNFETKELISFRFCSSIGEFAFVDMALTEDNKYMWYETDSASDEYAVSLLAKRDNFEASAVNIEKLSVFFDNEVQVYMDILENEINGAN